MDNQQQEALSFKEMILARAEQKKKAYDDAHWGHIADYVTTAKRNAGDYLGVMRSDRRNHWNPVRSNAFVTYPVVERTLRSKTATSLATNIQLDIQPVLKLPEQKAAAEIALNIYKYAEEREWNERFETMIALLGQIGKFAGVLTETKEGVIVGYREAEKESQVRTRDFEISCLGCGATFTPDQLGIQRQPAEETIEESPEIEAREQNPEGQEIEQTEPQPPIDLSQARCLNPECGSDQLDISQAEEFENRMIPSDEKEAIRAAEIKTSVISSLLIRYDDLHTIGFDWQKAHWFNYHPIETVYEICENHPEIKEKVQNKDIGQWADSTRWYYELTKANGNLGIVGEKQKDFYDELVEADYFWFEPIMCGNWKEPNPDGYKLVKKGKTVWEIKQDETIQQAFERQFQPSVEGEKFKLRGLMVKIVGEEITDVKNMSFLDVWVLIGWSLNPVSHLPKGEEGLLSLQDAFTKILSGIFSLAMRMSNPKGVIDSKFWNLEEFLDNTPGKWVETKQDLRIDEKPYQVTHGVGYIVPPNPPQFVMELINLLIQLVKEQSGVYDETVGQANPQNVTARGKEVALNQSLGLQAINSKLKKDGKIAWTKLILKLWQTFPNEAFILIKGTFEEEWKQQDIEAFKSLEIDAELLITAVEGSDIPKTPKGQLDNITIAAQMGLLGEIPPFAPEVGQYILKQALGLDFDIGNFEADRRLAGRRHEAMKEIAQAWAEKMKVGYDQLVVIDTEMDAMGNEIPKRVLHPELVLTYAQDLRTKVRQEDNHLVFIGYYIDQLKGVSGSKSPKEVDVLILETAIDFHRQMEAQAQAQALAAQTLAQQGMNQPALEEKMMLEGQKEVGGVQ